MGFRPPLSAGSGSGSQIVKVTPPGGNFPAAYTLDLSLTTADIVLVVGTLAPSSGTQVVATLTNRRKCLIIFLLTQPVGGGISFKVSDGSGGAGDPWTSGIATTANSFSRVVCDLPDATDVWPSVTGGASGGTAAGTTFAPAGNVAAANVQAAIAELDTEKQAVSEKGSANGYASLDSATKVPKAQIPALLAADLGFDPATQAELDAAIALLQLRSEKGAASGYAPLNSSSRVPPVNLGSGTADTTTFLRGDGSWQVGSGGGISQATADGRYAPQIPRLVLPTIFGQSIMIDSSQAATVNRVMGARAIIPRDGFLRDVCFWATTITGNYILAVYDTGDATPGSRHKLGDSGSVATSAGNQWKKWDPGATAIPVTQGQQLDLALMLDNTGTFGRGKTVLHQDALVLPTGFDVVPGGALPKLLWQNDPGSFAMPTDIAEASCVQAGVYPMLIARVA